MTETPGNAEASSGALPTTGLPAAVLAAGQVAPALRELTGASSKALITVGGRPMIDRMLEALRDASLVTQVRVLAAPGSEMLAYAGEAGAAVRGPEFLDTLHTAVEALGSPERLLVVTGDLPLLTAASLDHFVGEALQSEADLVYSVCRREDVERQYPGGQRTFVRLTDGEVTGANLAVFSSRFVREHGDRLAAAFAGRKHPVRLAALLGVGTVLRLLAGRASVAQMVRTAERALHASIHVVFSPYAEIGFDVDKPSNLESVQQWLATHETA
jgi:GTP:adenosylcobinamide-phosphate guanylyltransferase